MNKETYERRIHELEEEVKALQKDSTLSIANKENLRKAWIAIGDAFGFFDDMN